MCCYLLTVRVIYSLFYRPSHWRFITLELAAHMSAIFNGSGCDNISAAVYVDLIMSSQQAMRVTTPVHSGRTRNDSELCNTDCTVKEARATEKATRNLMVQSVPSDDSGKQTTSPLSRTSDYQAHCRYAYAVYCNE